ncbi:junctophilin-1 isoform X2 [Bombyx mandarina]|uniref:Junctophilin-1 isoform X2 n=1 Tax=Bombyx mandarina TaxID=7092 RepID=A0A6J2K6U7_BOMMA|nr:junctophilin-1 isoform X2 [Bombyx mandarina]
MRRAVLLAQERSGVHSAARRGATCPADVYLYRELGGGCAREALPSAAPRLRVMQPSELADAAHAASGNPPQRGLNGGRFDFDDGGTYCGSWDDGKAHGHGVCTGPKAQGAYAGSWNFGFEVSGVYTWPSGSTYEGQWQSGKRHGLGVENRDRWIYRGEWTQGSKGRYGVRQSTISNAKYEGTWANGFQDGYGSETYADGGTYQGQWMRGCRHGYGVRTSAPFGLASHYRAASRHHRGSMSSLTEVGSASDPSERRTNRMDDARGGFVLARRSDRPSGRRGSLFENTKKGLFTDEHLDANIIETYMGEWKNDKRTGYGISERSDGLRYEGEWFENRKYGYGVTTFRDNTKEEGKYKNNVLITSQKRKHMFLMRSAKFRERVDSAVNAAQRASKIALQKGDIAISRTATARGKAEQADAAADQAKEDCDIAQMTAKQFAPDFKHPGFDRIGLREKYRQKAYDAQVAPPVPQESEKILDGKSIPNHIPPTHSQLPQTNAVPNAMPRRLSTQYPKTTGNQPVDPRLANSSNYNSDNRNLGPPHDPYHSSQQDSWPTNSQSYIPDTHKQYVPNEQMNTYGTGSPGVPPNPSAPYRQNRQDSISQQQSYDQSGQPFTNQGRRLSSAVRATANQRPQQDWNAQPQTQQATRRQSVLGQPTYDTQANTYVDGRTEFRSGTVHSEGALLDNKQPGPTEPQNYRQNYDQDNNMYRQTTQPDQAYRQGTVDNQAYRQTHPSEQDAINGARDNRQPGTRPSIDYFDHYKRPPSRDSSVDRYGRRSRQPSVDATAPNPSSRSGSIAPQTISRPPSRAATPAGNGHLASGRGSISRASSREHHAFEDSLLRKRTLGQEISPSPYQPKRTESLYVAPNPTPPPPIQRAAGGGGGRKMLSTPQTLQRKKSLPDVASMPRAAETGMSREEVSALGSARREEVRRMHEESEKLRANPLLYLVSPQVKDWFSRQQLVILVLFINISLGIMFFKLLT